mgnify:CR=1 FL=1
MRTIPMPSPNFDPRPADTQIDILLLHYTGMESAAGALARRGRDRSALFPQIVVEAS